MCFESELTRKKTEMTEVTLELEIVDGADGAEIALKLE